jgi:TRAP-type C4-dicarboxylate transport system substrate-binding protein
MKIRMKPALLGTVITSAVVAGSLPALAESLTLRFSQWLPAAHFSQKNGLHALFKDMEKVTEGRVKVVLSAKALGPPPRQMQIAVDGVSDLSWGVHGYQPGVYPLAEMATLPFLTKSTEANSVAYWRVFKAMFEKAGMHPKGVHTIALHVHPPGHIYNNKRQIKMVRDLKGLKLRATNATVFRAFKAFGAVAISPAGGVTALHQGLSKGVMDGTSFTDEAIFNFKIAKYIKYATHVPGGLYNTSFYLVMNKKKWDRISKKDQAAITKVSGEAFARRIGKLWDAQDSTAVPKLKAVGVTTVMADARMMAQFKKIMDPVYKAWIAKAKKLGVDGEAALSMYKAEIAKN